MMLHNCLVCNKKIPFSIFGNPMGACPVLSDRHVVCERCTEKVRQFTTLKTGMYTEASFIKECSKYPELLEFVSSVADNDNLNQLLLHDDDTLISFANELLSYEEIAYLQHIGEEHKRKNFFGFRKR